MSDDLAVLVAAPPNTKPLARNQSPAKVIRAAVVGTVVEYYDFGIFGYMATTMAALFFVSGNPTASLLGTFATFAVAFFIRIPGGIFFGHIGDKYGRKTSLSWTILLMVAATAGMGLLPTYYTLGAWATAILVLGRCVQGLAAGGEVGGANAMVAESAPARWRGTQTSMVNTGTYFGSLCASLMALAITSFFDEQTILDWVWRIPFLLSVVLGGIGIWIRSQLEDTPEFEKLENSGEKQEVPIRELISTSGGTLVKIIFLGAMITAGYYIGSVYTATYLKTTVGHSSQVAFLSTAVALLLGIITLPLSGWASDTWGRKPVLFTGSAAGIVLGLPMFMMMSGGSVWQAIVGQSTLFICVSVVNGASFVTYAELLKTSVRYSGIALGNNTTVTLLGGTAPFIATFLISATGNPLAPAGHYVLAAALTFGAVFFIEETKGIALKSL